MSPSSPRPGWQRLAASPAVFFAVVFVLPLGFRPLLLPDEFRYAEIPREMLASGNWVVPRLDGLDYFEKPALGYWAVAASEVVFGRNRFAVRLPSALATGTAALLVALAVLRAGGERSGRVARLAALVFLSCLLASATGTIALLDATLNLFVTGALLAFFLATASPPSSGRERGFLLLSGVACGLAFLTKGFLALALPTLVAGAYLSWQKRFRDLVRMPWLPAVAAAVVAAPWSLAVHLRAPDFWRYFFWTEHVQRFFEKGVGQHPEPWWYYLAATPLVLLPWTFFLPAAVVGFRGSAQPPALRDLTRFCLTWVTMTYLFFSASSGKIVTYVLPAVPAVAILIAVGLSASEGAPRAWRRGGFGGAAVFGLAAVGCVVLLLTSPPDSRLGHDLGTWSPVVALALAAVIFVLAARAAPGARRPALAGWALVPLLMSVQIALPDRVLESKAPGAFLAARQDQVDAGDVVLSDSDTVRAVCWILERDDIVLVGPPGELRYGVEQDRSGARWVELADARNLIEENRGRVVLIADGSRYGQWKAQLPTPESEDSQAAGDGVVLVRY